MTRTDRTGRRGDLVAGLTVAVVLVPQALAYAELAGVPADRGLVTAAVAGLVGAALGSSPYLQTGPTALASLLTFGVLATAAPVGSERFVALAAALAVLAGLVRLVLGALRLGRVSYLLSPPVIAGLTAGAGLLIIASQVPGLVGATTAHSNPLRGAGAVLAAGELSLAAVLVGAVTVAVMVVAGRLDDRVPGALLALLAGTGLAAVLGEVPAVELGTPAFGVPVGELRWADASLLLVPALVVGVVGFSEAASIARRFAASERTRWRSSRELVGQGLACALAGAAGGFPTSGSFSRSALARMAGARTRLAGVVAGVLVLAVLPVTGLVPPIPRPALAALVAVAGASLIDVAPLRRLYAHARLQWMVAVGTFFATLLLAPRIDLAVLVGVLLAVGAHLLREEQLQLRAVHAGDTVHVTVHGVIFYISAPRLVSSLEAILADHPDVDTLELDLVGAGRIDVSGAVALADAFEAFEEAGVSVRVVGVPPQSEKILTRLVGSHLT